VLGKLQENFRQLLNRYEASTQVLFENQQSMKAGLDAAEFNLRAYQKVLDDIMSAKVRVCSGDPNAVVVTAENTRIDWPSYHAEVEKDMKELADIERQRVHEQRLARFKAVEAHLEEFEKRALEEIHEDEGAVKHFTDISARSATEIEKMKSGQEYDADVVDRWVSVINYYRKKWAAKDATKEVRPEEPVEFGG